MGNTQLHPTINQRIVICISAAASLAVAWSLPQWNETLPVGGFSLVVSIAMWCYWKYPPITGPQPKFEVDLSPAGIDRLLRVLYPTDQSPVDPYPLERCDLALIRAQFADLFFNARISNHLLIPWDKVACAAGLPEETIRRIEFGQFEQVTLADVHQLLEHYGIPHAP